MPARDRSPAQGQPPAAPTGPDGAESKADRAEDESEQRDDPDECQPWRQHQREHDEHGYDDSVDQQGAP
jgi:hypothetical protein